MSFWDWFKRTPPEQWRLVKRIDYGKVTYGNNSQPEHRIEGEMYYFLFESDQGGRCIQVKCTLREDDLKKDKLHAFAKSTKIYHTKIYRWLMGRGDPEIPRYDEVDQEETMHALTGTIEETLEVD